MKTPVCPDCGANMVERKSAKGFSFWGCPRFPRCKGIVKMVREVAVSEYDVNAYDTYTFSKYQEAFFTALKNTTNNIGLIATAGSGKTTTLAFATRYIDSTCKTALIAYNKKIIEANQKKIPSWVECGTFNRFGNLCVKSYFGNKVTFVEDKKTRTHFMAWLNQNYCETDPEYHNIKGNAGNFDKIISLFKCNLLMCDQDSFNEMTDRYNIQWNLDVALAYDITESVFLSVFSDMTTYDYDDQVWWPALELCPTIKYKYILTDESQDSNKMQVRFLMLMLADDGRMIYVGDPFQSIYGFRGADTRAMDRLQYEFGATIMPLSICYRCSKAVGGKVNADFPEIPFEVWDKAVEGLVEDISMSTFTNTVKVGDMVICRNNAPLVKPAFELIRKGIKAVIMGRDIGNNLMSVINKLVNKFKCESLGDLLEAIDTYREAETAKYSRANQGSYIDTLNDKLDTITAIADGADSIEDVEAKINQIFSDYEGAVTLSSCHKAKGLEAETVFILHPELMPSPRATTDEEKDQERNLKFVAETRAKVNMFFVVA